MAIADTSVLAPLFNSTHPAHPSCQAWIEGTERLEVPTVVLVELSTYLRRVANREGLDGVTVARSALHHLLSLPGVLNSDPRVEPALERYHASPELSLADALVIQLALDRQQELLTRDPAMEAHWRRVTRF